VIAASIRAAGRGPSRGARAPRRPGAPAAGSGRCRVREAGWCAVIAACLPVAMCLRSLEASENTGSWNA